MSLYVAFMRYMIKAEIYTMASCLAVVIVNAFVYAFITVYLVGLGAVVTTYIGQVVSLIGGAYSSLILSFVITKK